MIKGIKEYIIKPADSPGYFEGLALKGKPGKHLQYEYYPSLTQNELEGKTIYLILKPRSFYYEIYRVNLPVFNKQAMYLRLKDRIDSQGFLTGPYRLFWQVIDQEDTLYNVYVLAVPDNEISPIVAPLKAQAKTKIKFIAFLPFLLARLAEVEPQIIVHKEMEGIWLTLAEKSIPYFVEFIPVDEMVGINYTNLGSRISFFQRLYRSDTGKEANIITTTSEELKVGLESAGFNNISVASNFNLYLTIFEISQQFNLLPEEELAILKVMELNKKIAYGMYGLSILLLIFFGTTWFFNKKIEKEIEKKEGILTQSINQLLSQYPQDMIKQFQNFLTLKKELEGYPKVSEIIYNLTNLDEDYSINELSIVRSGKDYQITLQFEKKIEPDRITDFHHSLLTKISDFTITNETNTRYNIENRVLNVYIKGIVKKRSS